MRAPHILSFFLVATLLFAPLVIADERRAATTAWVDADADGYGELSSIDDTISQIKRALDRCETDVCRQVRANADKRHELTHVAQQNRGVARSSMLEVQTIVRADIDVLSRCRDDVCREALMLEERLLALVNDYLDLDSDGDGIPDRVERTGDLDSDSDGIGDVVERVGDFGKIEITYKPQGRTASGLDGIVAPDMITSVHGGGMGKVSIQDLKMQRCPETGCPIEVHVERTDGPTMAARFSVDFPTPDMALGLDGVTDVVWDLGADVRCAEMRGTIRCEGADGSLALFTFIDATQTTCTARQDDLWCWGTARDGGETEARFSKHRQTAKTDFGSTACVGNDCDDVDSDVRPGATVDVSGEIMLEDGRELRSQDCTDDSCVVGIAARCGDDRCVVSAAEHCREDRCVAEVARHCDGGVCREQLRRDDAVIHRDIASRTAADKATPLLARGVSPRNLTGEDRDGIREYLRNQSELRGADFGLAVALLASENERVRSIRYDEERNIVEVEHEEEMRLFGFLRVQATSKTTVHEDGTEETRRPWWSFLAAKDNNPKFKAGADLSKSVNAQADFEYCPDGTMVQSLADCPQHQDGDVAAMNNAPCLDGQILCPDGTCQPFGASMGDACEGHANNDDALVREGIIDALDVDDDGDGIPTRENGEEVDILGMGEEKLTNEETARTGRNPQTGKEIQ